MQTLTQELPVNLNQSVKNIGMVMMTLAATLGMVELPESPNAKVTVNSQPALIFATENGGPAEHPTTQRREREEAGPHYISYSAAMRTPGRTGKY